MSFTRRGFVKTIAGASLASAAPGSFGACARRADVPIAQVPGPWSNWPQSEPVGPSMKYMPANIGQLVTIARNASSTARVKASGTRWSSSAAARTEGVWIDTSALSGLIIQDMNALAVDFLPAGDRGNLFIVRGGTKIHTLATELWARGKSIPTLGGSMGQSIAGAISTGTHGSDIALPPIAGMVRAIHLVAPGGNEFWLEHPAKPVASRQSLHNYVDWCDSIATFRDADAFNAALVSAGRCGVVYAYVLQVEPRFQLRADRGRTSWRDVRTHLERAADDTNWVDFIRSHQLPFNENTKVRSSGTPSAISVNGKLSLLWTGERNPGQFRWIHQDPATGEWSRKRIVDDGDVRHSTHKPAIAFFKGQYYIAWTGVHPDHPYVHLMRSDDTGEFWSGHIKFDGEAGRRKAESSQGPVLLAANDRLHMVWVGSNNARKLRWIYSSDGVSWSEPEFVAIPGMSYESHYRPALAFHRKRYYLAWTGTDSHLIVLRSNEVSASNPMGMPWYRLYVFDGSPSSLPEAKSSDGPCLLSANNKLHLVWVGTNKPGEFRWVTSSAGTSWIDKRTLKDGATRMSRYSPEMVFHDGHYYLFWTGYDGDENVEVLRSTTDTGRTWTGHAKLSVPPGPRLDMPATRSLDVVLSPESANDAAWWTVRSVAGMEQKPTRVAPGLSTLEQRILIEAVAFALKLVGSGPSGGFLVQLANIITGGLSGGALHMIKDAVASGNVADSEDVIVAILDLVFAQQVDAPPTIGPNYEITSGNALKQGSYEKKYQEFWDLAPKVQYTEVFFNAQDKNYLVFVQRVLDLFQASPSRQQGYIAIRFTGMSDAPLGMQRWPVTAAVEVVILQALDPISKPSIVQVNNLAQSFNARFHLGMIRPAGFRPPGLQTDLELWRVGARRLLVRANDGFSSAFSRDSGLEP